MKRIAWAAAAAAVLGVALTATPASAAPTPTGANPSIVVAATPATFEVDTAVAGSRPPSTGVSCRSYVDDGGRLLSEACFQLHGDKIWVRDDLVDGHAAVGAWQNYLRDPSGTWVLYRYGRCDNKMGAGSWGVCDKNFYEDTTSPNALGGTGSGLRLFACTSVDCIFPYAWIRNNA